MIMSDLSTSTVCRVALLVAASIALSLGFACAVPLAAFAAIAALSFARRDALIAIFAVWFVNQLIGFAVLHYPLDATTFAWGAVLGVLALIACEAARLANGPDNIVGAAVTFLAAFAAYEGGLVAIDVTTGQSPEYYAAAVVARVFLINASAFGAIWAVEALLTPEKSRRAPSYGAGLKTVN